MPPTLALLLWAVLLCGLLWWDPAKVPGISSNALWVPVIWIFIIGSRLPSQWLGGSVGRSAEAMEEGSPIDRTIFSILIFLAIGILASRPFDLRAFLVRNMALVAFLVFALLSVLWSDSPFIAFKRWFRDLGNYLVILVATSAPRPLEAVRTLLRRLCYLLIPLSILLVKYFPEMAKQYDPWSGIATYAGATTSKNMLGVACLISGLFFFWDTVTRWSDREQKRRKHIILLNVVFMGMTLWLLNISNSATSRLCLAVGALVIITSQSKMFRRHPNFFKALIPAGFLLYLILAYGFDLNAQVAGAVGRDPTLTDRTKIWGLLITMQTNPLLGTGYETFWLGPRLMTIWSRFGPLNEAHNGYLEVYLNLGIIGLILLGVYLGACYRQIFRSFKSSSTLPSFTLSLWTILLFYNVSEAAFKGQLMWLIFLVGAIAVAERADAKGSGHSTGQPFSQPPVQGGYYGAEWHSAAIPEATPER
jgi:exopolysaccharide production protein ExoQ